jgi:hypothetical protein
MSNRIVYTSEIWEEMRSARERGTEMGLTLIDAVGVEGAKRVVLDVINNGANKPVEHERYAYVDGIMNAIYTAEQAALAEAMGAGKNG